MQWINKYNVILGYKYDEYDDEYGDDFEDKMSVDVNKKHKKPLNIRKDFPETWLWDNFKFDGDLRLLKEDLI